MNIAICEDSLDCTSFLMESISKWANLRNILVNYKCFQTPDELKSYLESTYDMDVLFLDVFFGESHIDGMTLAKHLRKVGISKPIIFVTSDSSQASNGYLVEALGFLTKPIDEERLFLFMDRLLSKERENQKYIEVKIGGEIIKISQKDIVYIEKMNHTLIYHTLQDKISFRYRLNDAISKLDEDVFVQIHRSYVVSISKVYSIKSTYPYSVVVLKNDIKIVLSVSRNFIDNLKAKYINYLRGGVM